MEVLAINKWDPIDSVGRVNAGGSLAGYGVRGEKEVTKRVRPEDFWSVGTQKTASETVTQGSIGSFSYAIQLR